MAVVETWARLIWSSQDAGVSSTLTATGNSGNWALPTAPNNFPSSPVDLDRASDFLLTATCSGATGTTPSLVASLNGFDEYGNVVGPLFSVTALTSATTKFASGGLRGPTSALYFVAPLWGQVAWTITGTTPSFTGVQICLYGR